MTKIKKRLLRVLKNIILCVAVAILGGLGINQHIKNVVKKTTEDIIRTEWVKAAREVPSLVTLGSNDTTRTNR